MPLFKHQHRDSRDSRAEPAPVAKLRNLLEPNRLFNRRSIADLSDARSRSASPHLLAAADEHVQRVKIPINGDAAAHSPPHVNEVNDVNGLELNALDLTLKPTPPTSVDARSISPPASTTAGSAAAPNFAAPDHLTPPRSPSDADAAVPGPGRPVQNGVPAAAAAADSESQTSGTRDPTDQQHPTLPDPTAEPSGSTMASAFPVPAKGEHSNITQRSQLPAAERQLTIDTHEDAPRASMDTAGFATPQSISPTSSGIPDVFMTPRRSMEPAEAHQTFSAIDEPSSDLPPAPTGELRRPSLTSGERQRRISAMSSGSISPVGSPRRMSAVLHSPPMPQPIANLPTLGGPSRTGPPTPSWGALALEGGPKSPQIQSPTGNPGGFPFFSGSPTTSRNNSKDLSDAEVRKATKSMVSFYVHCVADASLSCSACRATTPRTSSTAAKPKTTTGTTTT